MLTIDGEKYLVEKELSHKYGLSIHFFRRSRYERGAPHHRLNGKIYYKEDELDNWFKQNMIPNQK